MRKTTNEIIWTPSSPIVKSNRQSGKKKKKEIRKRKEEMCDRERVTFPFQADWRVGLIEAWNRSETFRIRAFVGNYFGPRFMNYITDAERYGTPSPE